MKKILVPIDFSNDSLNALEFAIFIANKCNAHLQMLHVKANKNFDVPFQIKDVDLPYGDMLKDFFKLIYERYEKKYLAEGVFDYVVREGKIYEEITSYSEENGTTLIVMGTHGVSGFEERWIGSNAYRTVSNSKCPVITIRNGYKAREIKNVVIPFIANEKPVEVLKTMAEFVKNLNLRIDLLAILDEEKKSIDLEQTSHFDNIVNELHLEGLHSRIVPKAAEDFIDGTIDYAQEVDAELICLLSERSKNPLDYILGTSSRAMVNHSPIPVMSIFPETK